jgi:hypothetical protein
LDGVVVDEVRFGIIFVDVEGDDGMVSDFVNCGVEVFSVDIY